MPTPLPPPEADTAAKSTSRKLLVEHCGNMIHALEDGLTSSSVAREKAPLRHESARLKVLLDLFVGNDPRIVEIIHQAIH